MALSSDFRHLQTLLATRSVFHLFWRWQAVAHAPFQQPRNAAVLKCSRPKTSDTAIWASLQGFWYFAQSRTREIQVFPRNSQKNVKYRQIRQKYFQIHVGKTYLILILAIRPVLFTPNVQIYLETSSLQRVNNVPKLPGSLDERCEKLGTNHNINSLSIRSFLERTVVERANEYPY